jgi:hypothetical protein
MFVFKIIFNGSILKRKIDTTKAHLRNAKKLYTFLSTIDFWHALFLEMFSKA